MALAADLFSRVERALDLPHRSIKMGVMDEERRTSANLPQARTPNPNRLSARADHGATTVGQTETT